MTKLRNLLFTILAIATSFTPAYAQDCTIPLDLFGEPGSYCGYFTEDAEPAIREHDAICQPGDNPLVQFWVSQECVDVVVRGVVTVTLLNQYDTTDHLISIKKPQRVKIRRGNYELVTIALPAFTRHNPAGIVEEVPVRVTTTSNDGTPGVPFKLQPLKVQTVPPLPPLPPSPPPPPPPLPTTTLPTEDQVAND